MSSPFASLYASTYDALYRSKDYAGECRLVERLLREHGDGSMQTLLDLGCGTANHAALLADAGYSVVGVERSQEMLDRAREKAASRPSLELHRSDIKELDLGREFDAALLLFAVLGYQVRDEDVIEALAATRRHLRPGGLAIFDVWFGPAVLHERPSARFSRIPLDEGELLRGVSPSLDLNGHVCRVAYELWHVDGERVLSTAREEHEMRFFFPAELRLLLRAAGFSLLRLSPFPDVDSVVDETTWNVIGVARAEPAT